MITSLVLFQFKNFDQQALRVGPFSVIVGSNASGKSNIRDAFRVLHGIGRGYTVAEIIGGKYGAGGQVEWEQIRGSPREIATLDQDVFGISANFTFEESKLNFFVAFRPEILGFSGFRIAHEELSINQKKIYLMKNMAFEILPENIHRNLDYLLRREQPILNQMHQLSLDHEIEQQIGHVVDALASMRFLDLVPNRMRLPSFPGQTVLGDNGENLPTVLKALCTDPAKKDVLTQWTRELTPMDVQDFEFPDGPTGMIHLVLRERSGKGISAESASDGTLRFLAMLATLLGPEPARLYFFEEIDNGIHPSRLNLLIDLIEKQTAKGETQLIATTHSPQMLSMISDITFGNTSIVCRLDDSENAIIRPVAELPNAKELRTTQGLGRLLAGGWMETALAFTEGNNGEGKASE